MRIILLFVIVITFVISCSENAEKKITTSPDVVMIESPAGDSCAEPYLFTDTKGIVYLSWIEKVGKQSTLRFCSLENEKWSSPVTIASGNNWFVNWADYPVLAADGNNSLIAHYLEKSDTAKFTYDVKLILSSDSGQTWTGSKTLHDDNIKAEHGFVSIIPYKDKFFVSWLDGRKTATNDEHSDHDHHGEMTLRAAFIDKDGNKTGEWELDGRICDCCQTTAAITNDGPVVVYRDRSDDEIRDMSIVRFVNEQWTTPKTIHADNWQIKACPVNGPRVDAIKNDLAIAWFSMKDKKGEVKVIFSNDGGAGFSAPIKIDEGNAIGRVDIVMLDENNAIASWMEGSSIKAIKVHKDGTKDPSMIIASSSDKRSSGFPQMTKAGDKVIFAWTDDKAKTIRVAQLKP